MCSMSTDMLPLTVEIKINIGKPIAFYCNYIKSTGHAAGLENDKCFYTQKAELTVHDHVKKGLN